MASPDVTKNKGFFKNIFPAWWRNGLFYNHKMWEVSWKVVIIDTAIAIFWEIHEPQVK